jgi:hypothetical protein
MDLLACWVVFPLLLGLLAQGCGSLLERVAGRGLPVTVRLPCGLAVIIAELDLVTRTTTTAAWAVPLAVALGVVGLLLSPPWPIRRPDPAWAAAGLVFAVFAAPIVLSGEPTWAGYIKLDDTSTWLALADRALSQGHSIAGLPPSTYQLALANYLTTGYPLGAFLPLGLGHQLVGQDAAWLVSPWMSFLAAMLALALYRMVSLAVPATRWRIGIVFIAAQPALLYGYYLWGGIKEMAGAALVAAFAVTAALPLSGERRWRAAAPAAVVLVATISSLSTGGLVWIVPGGVLATLALWLRGRPRLPSARFAIGAAVLVGIAAYLVLRPNGFYERYKSVLTSSSELGNLVKPLNVLQLAGIWPNGDFRFQPPDLTVAYILIGVLLLGAALGVVTAVARRQVELLLYVLCAVVGALLVYAIASPWLGGKALATASPALLVAALTGAAALVGRGRDLEGGVIAGAIAAGVLWSSALAYHDVSLAPHDQFNELAAIGHRIAGQGPTLMTSYQPYGVRHFLRDADPESASELRSRVDPLLSGQPLPKGGYADMDQLQLSGILQYRTLVLQRSPVGSRPPSPYRLIYRGRYWDVWQRPAVSAVRVLATLPLGDSIHPGAVAPCNVVQALARTSGARGLIAAPASNPIVVGAGQGRHPAGWGGPSAIGLVTPGDSLVDVTVPTAGRYGVWLGGSIHGPVSVRVGPAQWNVRNQIQEAEQYVPLGEVDLGAGMHTVDIHYPGGDWLPGSGAPPDVVGPLVLAGLATQGPAPLLHLPVSQAGSLCGRTLDWVEVVA